jgi:Leucine-rich repeat (LRR) protein
LVLALVCLAIISCKKKDNDDNNENTDIDPCLNVSGYTDIPDQDFEQALIDLGHDNTIDGRVLSSNICGITSLGLQQLYIKDLTGIEAFTNLTELYLQENLLTSLDVSNNTSLTILICLSNELTSIDISTNTALTVLNCDVNQLTSLEISQNIALESLGCSYNQLTNLDVSQNTALTALDCSRNELTSLDVSQNSKITSLGCGGNELTSLDISQNSKITSLGISNNPMTCLNLKNSNNIAISSINFDLTNLSCVEVDNPNWSDQNWGTYIGSNPVAFSYSTDCNYPAGCF